MSDKLSAITLAQSADQIKMGALSEMGSKHIALMEALSRKCDAQGTAIVENRKILQEKLLTF